MYRRLTRGNLPRFYLPALGGSRGRMTIGPDRNHRAQALLSPRGGVRTGHTKMAARSQACELCPVPPTLKRATHPFSESPSYGSSFVRSTRAGARASWGLIPVFDWPTFTSDNRILIGELGHDEVGATRLASSKP